MRSWILGFVIVTQAIGCTDIQVNPVASGTERRAESPERNPNLFPAGSPAVNPSPVPTDLPATSPTGNLNPVPFRSLEPSPPISRIDGPLDYANGLITTVVGGGTYDPHSGVPDREAATSVYLDNPRALAVHKDGTIYVADTFGIRRVSPAGISTFLLQKAIPSSWTPNAGSTSEPYWDASLCVDLAGDVLVGGTATLQRYGAGGVVTVVAGQSKGTMPADGVRALDADLGNPIRVLHVDAAGTIYIASRRGIDRIKPDGTLALFAGNGKWARAEQATANTPVPAKELSLLGPTAVTTDAKQNVYLADGGNYRVWRIDPAGMATLVAGTGVRGHEGDGGPATLATFDEIPGLATAPDGTLLIADRYNGRVRHIDAQGIITTVCGGNNVVPPTGKLGDGGPAKTAILGYPSGLICADDGALYILSNGPVRKIAPVSRVSPTVP